MDTAPTLTALEEAILTFFDHLPVDTMQALATVHVKPHDDSTPAATLDFTCARCGKTWKTGSTRHSTATGKAGSPRCAPFPAPPWAGGYSATIRSA
ncbi:hypothetical protein [Pseudomonas sp.]|uniref:hypothetical protein n=1 Tax=Pseudomonas sp. TaxID=306 RepID=UPI003D0E58DA